MKNIATALLISVFAQQAACASLQELGDEIRQRLKDRDDNPQLYQQKVRVSTNEYLNCARDASPLLDDRISDAATVAIALQAHCYEHLSAIAENSGSSPKAWGEMLHPRVIKTFLTYRASRLKPAAKTQGAKPTS